MKDITQDSAISSLLLSFLRERPRSSSVLPKWDLSLVLMALTRPPFEPLASAEPKFLTWKTAFLTLLASGSRRGEVHALSREKISHDPRWRSIQLSPHGDFVSKTQLRSSGARAFQAISIPALGPSLSPDLKEDRSLCPVRALKIYLSKTESKAKDKKLLFVAYKQGHRGDIHKNTLSGWVRKLIKYVYRTASGDVLPLANLSVHEVRAQAASLAFRGNVDMEDLLHACTWASQNTFTDFYLRDLEVIQGDLRKLGPLVAAQTVVNLS